MSVGVLDVVSKNLVGALVEQAFGSDLLDLSKGLKRSQGTLESDVQEAISSLEKTSGLVGQLETNLRSKTKQLLEIQTEYERLSELTDISTEQISALTKQIETSIGRSQRWGWLKSLGINLVAGAIVFVVGVFAAEPIKDVWQTWTVEQSTTSQ